MNLKTLKTNIYTSLILRFALVMLMYTISRIAFYLFNLNSYSNVKFSELSYMIYGGFKFDISALIYLNLLFILLHLIPFKIRYSKLYQKIIKYVYLIINSIGIIINNSDIIYYRFTLKRTTSTIFREFQNEGQIFKLMLSFIFDYWYITIFTIIQIFILCYLYNKIKTGTALIKNNIYHIASSLALLVLFAGLCLAGMRGGFRHSTRPITLSNASKYTSSPDQRAIVLNTPFSIFRTLSKKAIKRYEFFTDDEISKIYKAKKTNTNTRDSITNKKPTNVVVIILESFSKEHFGFFNKDIKNYKGYTPFLDSLCNHSYVIQNSYANGRKSIDALPSILTSIPQIVEPFVLSHYSGNKINSIASVLKDKSYYSAFFHGAPNGSMGFQSFIKQAGFDDYFGKTEFNNNKEFDGMWGIWDEPFFQFYAEKMDSFKQPFVSAIFSVSSHHPYKVPEQHKGKFKEGKLPVQKSIGYTDYALKRFFEKAKTMDWYKNSLFVITADHSISPYLEKYKTTYNKFSVPIIFHKPNSDLIKNDSISIAQQIDIMPSILSILGYDKKYIAFGNSIFNKEDNYAIQYIGGLFQVLDKDYLLQFDGNNTTGFFNIKEDYFMKTNLVNQNLEIQKKYEQRIKAFLQEYSNRMLDNKLTIN